MQIRLVCHFITKHILVFCSDIEGNRSTVALFECFRTNIICNIQSDFFGFKDCWLTWNLWSPWSVLRLLNKEFRKIHTIIRYISSLYNTLKCNDLLWNIDVMVGYFINTWNVSKTRYRYGHENFQKVESMAGWASKSFEWMSKRSLC